LFAGASRDIKTGSGLTALELLQKNEQALEDREFKSMQFILSDYKERFCF
jgi:hypothetical protein